MNIIKFLPTAGVRKFFLVSAFLFLGFLNARSQVTISGVVQEDAMNPASRVNVLLRLTTSSGTFTAATITNEQGAFEYSSTSALSEGEAVVMVWDCHNLLVDSTVQCNSSACVVNLNGVCANPIAPTEDRCNLGFESLVAPFAPDQVQFAVARVLNGKFVSTDNSNWDYGDGQTAPGNNSTPMGPAHKFPSHPRDTSYTVCLSGNFGTCASNFCDQVFVKGDGSASLRRIAEDRIKMQMDVKNETISFDLGKTEVDEVQYHISNAQGAIVAKGKPGTTSHSVQFSYSGLKTGVYLFQLTSNKGSFSRRFVVAR